MLTSRRRGRCASAQSGSGFRMELIEPRWHASVSTWTSSAISDIFGTINAQALFGDNGDPWGYATGVAGIGSNEDVVQYVVWDGDLSNGVNSGICDFSFSVNKQNNGQATFNAGGQAQSFSVGTSGTFSSVTIRSAVMGAGMSMSMTDISVKFYQNGQLAQTYSGYNVTADRFNSNYNVPLESGLTITASGGGTFNGVEVTAKIQMKAAEGVYPGAGDIFANVAIG